MLHECTVFPLILGKCSKHDPEVGCKALKV